jgi:hypothetical protein
VPKPGSERLGEQETARAIASANSGRLVEKRSRVEYLEEPRVGMADCVAVCCTQGASGAES